MPVSQWMNKSWKLHVLSKKIKLTKYKEPDQNQMKELAEVWTKLLEEGVSVQQLIDQWALANLACLTTLFRGKIRIQV